MDQITDLVQIINECIDILKFKADMKKIELKASISQDFPTEILIDGNRVQQILINLVSNALKYTNQGSVTVEAVVEEAKIRLSVRDTGVGIQPSKLGSLFTAFTKIKLNRELNTEGVGLGLTISKNISTAMGGDISVQSTLGRGSVFSVTLPLSRY